MKALLTGRAAVLQALYEGPGACAQLIDRVSRSSQERIRLRQGPVSLALRELESEGLVRSWERPIAGPGRPRHVYELTTQGVVEATAQRDALRAVVGEASAAPRPSSRERRAMSERLATAIALSDFALTLQNAPRRPI